MSALGHDWPRPDDEDWRTRAACRGQDPALFFAPPSDTVARKTALTLCADCPVRTECLADALSVPFLEDHGIRAGLTERARRKMTRNLRPGVDSGKCDTNAGYYRHLRNHEDACDGCAEAHRAYNRARRAAQREAS